MGCGAGGGGAVWGEEEEEGRCIQGCWDADVLSLGLFFPSSPPRHLSTSPQLTSGAPRTVGAGSLGGGVREGGAGLRGALCVCLSVGDCIRRCSSITARVAVVCAAALVWQRRWGGGGAE